MGLVCFASRIASSVDGSLKPQGGSRCRRQNLWQKKSKLVTFQPRADNDPRKLTFGQSNSVDDKVRAQVDFSGGTTGHKGEFRLSQATKIYDHGVDLGRVEFLLGDE